VRLKRRLKKLLQQPSNLAIILKGSLDPFFVTIYSMFIETRQSGSKWLAYVWAENEYEMDVYNETYPEETYVFINDWCKTTFGKPLRTAYNVFEFKKRQHLDWFLLKWA